MQYTISQLPKELQYIALDNFADSSEYEAITLRQKNLIIDEVKDFCKHTGIKYGGKQLTVYDNYCNIYVNDFKETRSEQPEFDDCYYGYLMAMWHSQRTLIETWLDLARLGYDSYIEEERNCFGDYWWYGEDVTLEEYMEQYEERATEMADKFMGLLKAVIDDWLDGEDDYIDSFDFVEDEGILFTSDGMPVSKAA
jgi:small nuclear ribonucleoprotein (snRNP)-like protein